MITRQLSLPRKDNIKMARQVRDNLLALRLHMTGFMRLSLGASGILLVGCGAGSSHESTASTHQSEHVVTSADDAPPDSEQVGAEGWFNLVRDRIDVGSYRFLAKDFGFDAFSGGQSIRAHFDREGTHVSRVQSEDADSRSQVTLRFASWGRPGAERPLESAQPVVGVCNDPKRIDEHGKCVQRLERTYDGIVEWWDNTPRGLQQAWTIEARPQGTGQVQLLVRVEGAVPHSGGSNVVDLRSPHGDVLFDYDELHIVDADGKAIAGTLHAERGHIAISFDDREARYPITVDPLVSSVWQAEPTNQESSWLGLRMVAIGDVNQDGLDDVAIGAHGFHGAQIFAGKVFVYHGANDGLQGNWGPESTPAWEMVGGNEAGFFGYGLAGGDYNGDGYSDLVVGEPTRNTVFAYLGSSTGLALSPASTVIGGSGNDQFGWTIACAGDVNADGRSDLIVGAPFRSAPEHEEGSASLYLGTAAGLSAAAAWTQQGNKVNGKFGFGLAGVGDVNGDGRSDVVVGAPGADGVGQAHGYLGTATGLAAASWTGTGTQVGEAFGNNIAPAGDENADGYADVAISAPAHDAAGLVDAGRFVLVAGSSTGFGSSTSEVGTFAGQQLGLSLSAASDVNGDGKADLARGDGVFGRVRFGRGTRPSEQDADIQGPVTVGAGDVNGDGLADVLTSDPYSNQGRGRVGIELGYPAHAPGDPLDAALTDSQPGAQFGSALADAGDVNGDGYADLVIGAKAANPSAINQAGKAYVAYGGPTPPVSFQVSGQQPSGALGTAVAGCDFNDDGFSDVAVSEPGYFNFGRVTVYYGSAAGLSLARSSWHLGSQAGAQFGAALAAGDVNGDGYCDLAVGAPLHDDTTVDEGRVFIYRGASANLAASPQQFLENDSAGSQFGGAVSLGDVNGDGRKDLAVGAKQFTNGQAGEGRVAVYIATAQGSFSTTPSWSAEGESVGAAFGAAVSIEGDTNLDGKADLVIGAPTYTGSLAQQGRVSYYKSLGTGFTFKEQEVGIAAGARLGSAIAAGDHNGDSFADWAYSGSAVVVGRLGGKDGWSNRSFTKLPLSGETEFGRSVSLRGDLNGDGSSDLAVGLNLASGGAVKRWRHELGGVRLQALRPGTNIPIAPGGRTIGNAVDIRLLARSPLGRIPVKLEVHVQPCLADVRPTQKSAVWVNSGVSGTSLRVSVTGLTASTPYSYRARVLYKPLLGFGATHSRWYYGGAQGHARCGTHFRTP